MQRDISTSYGFEQKSWQQEGKSCIPSTFAAETQTNAKAAGSAPNTSIVPEWANPA
jgi:hypothetical protein